jgi:hypothetical protein
VCFLRPNSQCAQKLFRGLGPVVIDIRLAFQTVRDAMTISPVSLQNLHLMSAMAFCLPRRPDDRRALPRAGGNAGDVSPCLLRFFFRHHVADARISDPVAETLTEST